MSVNLASLVTQFLERHGLANSTIRSYESTLMPLLQLYGSWSLEIIDREILVEYLNDLNNVSYITHHRHQAVITALFNFAVECRYIKSNPISHLKRRKPNPRIGEHNSDLVVRYLTQHQLSILYQAIKKDARLNALVHLLHSSGARIAEILALDLSDIDFTARSFQVIGKGNKQRWCFYNEDTHSCLNNYIKYYRNPQINALFTAQKPNNQQVSRLSYATAYSTLVNSAKNIPELEGVGFHQLRHTFASQRVGIMGVEELRALMGHEKIQTTLRYSKVTSQRAQEVALQAFEKIPPFGQ
ncbi:tyrosine-type recombinase/integrase [Nostoc sp. CCCryo 231-06]|nr:tyrosine-type recombinase/integrase [Nostoc sp. CCCryo 231-06]